MYQRTPVHLNPAVIGGDLASLSSHPDYAAAKAGDVESAVRLARAIVTDDLVQRVRDMIGESDPIVVPVVSEEASGRNKIPLAAAEVLAERLGVETTGSIGQRNAPRRTAMSGLDRIFASPVFDGDVVAGRDYLILDDTLTQGATFAALSSHIEAGGDRVVGTLALTGKQYIARNCNPIPIPLPRFVRNMATLSKSSSQQQATASTRSPSPKPDTSRTSNRLSDSEFASLMKDAADARVRIKELLKT